MLGAEDQIAFGLPGPMVIGIAMNRDRRDFSERDRALLDLLRPHLAQAHRRIVERMQLGALVAALEHGAGRDGTGILILDRNGGIAVAAGAAIELLAEYFPGDRQASVPAEITDWLAGGSERDPLRLEAERGCLTVHEAPPGARRRLCLLAAGKGTAEIADALFISRHTVRKHYERVYARLGVNSRAAAVAAAFEASRR